MGMKAMLVAVSDGLPRDDLASQPIRPVEASRRAAESVLPGLIGDQLPDGDLGDHCYPYDGVYAGTFGGTWLVASQHDALLDWSPAAIDRSRNGYRVFMQSVVTTAGFTYWAADGTLREFFGSWEDGAPVNSGASLAFETPFWAGDMDVYGEAAALHGDEMPFNPMDLGEEALRAFFGFVGEGTPRPDDLDPFEIPLHGFELLTAPIPVPQPARKPAKTGGLFSRLRGRS